MDCQVCRAPLDGTSRFCARCGSPADAVAVRSPTAVAPATEAEPRYDPFIGQSVGGRYKITKLLGEGGMGAVYVGEQTIGTTLRKVAVKTLHAHLSKDPRILTRFERECATVAELQHPNTIQLYDFGKTDDGILYMVMEYVQGESLAAVLERKGALEPPRVWHILRQICDALGEAHTLGIVHRDLKPENIVLTERAKDWVKVLDFGIAKRTETPDKEEQKLTQQGTVLGTPPYMSPEQFTGRPIDARSDIYSIAVIGYEMLVGRLPFTAATPWEWATKHMTANPAPLSVTPTGAPIPETMIYAIMRALQKDPAERFATTREFFESMTVPPTSPEGMAISGGYAMAPASMMLAAAGSRVEIPVAEHAASVGAGAAGAALPPPTTPAGGLAHVVAPAAEAGIRGTAPMPGPGGGVPSANPSAALPSPSPGGEGRGKTQIGEPTPEAVAPYAPVPPVPAASAPLGAAPAYGGPPVALDGGPRRGRSGGGAILAVLAVAGLLAAGGIVFALTRPPRHLASKDPKNGPHTTTVDDAGEEPTPPDDHPHLPPLIDTSMPSLPTNFNGSGHGSGHHADAGLAPTPTPTPANDPHACKLARALQTKLSQSTNPTMKQLNQFNHERGKCISEGGHM